MSPDLNPTPGRRNNSASLRRAVSILLQLGESTDGTGYSLAELCKELDLNKSTLLRLLQPLLETRLVEHLPSGRYRLGWRMAQLGRAYLAGLDLPRAMHDVLQKLAAQTRETVHLVVADYPNIVYIHKVDTPHPVRMFSRIGNSAPAYCTSVGKAMLAHAAPETIELVIANGMPAHTPRTITTPEQLRAALAEIRDQGYSVDDIEHEEGIRCVAAPIFDHSQACTTAISVSAPAERLPAENLSELAPLVIAAAREISTRLGAIR
ncbi:IclR family transcriptional regulator [Streptomyces albipurpureus]|uniref:IclR family transcriptional regulator n=1 Tax=Streptomyces albipurpureus TaxID=2897419 RepID=A0ABT0URA5_9ACTN|nr:IclR family transcriptional regulator [Streptomyces sp. CWNU-1]MCM2389918.1 IclR family transcriptional regulator [Streptomyces sp. CWNU-1]